MTYDFLPAPSNPVSDHEESSDWGYTERATSEGIAAARKKVERMAGRRERDSIARDTRIDGGVYEGTYGGEAIVVDREKYPVGFKDAIDDVIHRIKKEDGSFDKGLVLKSVFDVVSETLTYDANAVEEIFQVDGKGRDGVKIALDHYIQAGKGVCRHQALLCGQLLEALKDFGVISGKVSVDRNMKRRDGSDKYDGHAWVRYTNSIGEVYILDVAQKRLAKLDDLMKAREVSPEIWDYARPEDYERRRAAIALTQSVIELPSTRPSSLEYDENGLIKVPDFFQTSKTTGISENPLDDTVEKYDNLIQKDTKNPHEEGYEYAMEQKRLAQKEGRGADSIYWGQVAGQHMRELQEASESDRRK